MYHIETVCGRAMELHSSIRNRIPWNHFKCSTHYVFLLSILPLEVTVPFRSYSALGIHHVRIFMSRNVVLCSHVTKCGACILAHLFFYHRDEWCFKICKFHKTVSLSCMASVSVYTFALKYRIHTTLTTRSFPSFAFNTTVNLKRKIDIKRQLLVHKISTNTYV